MMLVFYVLAFCEVNLIWLADGNKISKEANFIWLADSNKISK